MDAQERIESALYKAIEATSSLKDATQAMTKVAKEMDLNPHEIRTVAGAYNTSKAFRISKVADEAGKQKDFDLADPDVVIETIYPDPINKAASEQVETEQLSLPDLDKVDTDLAIKRAHKKLEEHHLEKTASEIPKIDERTTNISLKKIAKYEEDYPKIRKQLADKIEQKIQESSNRMKQALTKAASEFLKYPEKQRTKMARRVVNGFQTRGELMLQAISTLNNQEIPPITKTASHSILPTDNFFTYLAEADQMAASAGNATQIKEQLVKTAVFDNIAERLTATVPGLGPMVQAHLGDRDRSKLLQEKLSPDIYTKLKGLESRNAFMKAVMNNPNLMSFNLPALQDSFNYAIETNPTAAKTPRALSNIMLHNLNQDNVDDLFALQGKAGLEKATAEVEKARVGTQKDQDTLRRSQETRIKNLKEGSKKDIQPYDLQPGIDAGKGIVKSLGDAVNQLSDEERAKRIKSKEGSKKIIYEASDRGEKEAELKADSENIKKWLGKKSDKLSGTTPVLENRPRQVGSKWFKSPTKVKKHGILDVPIYRTDTDKVEPLNMEELGELVKRKEKGTASDEDLSLLRTLEELVEKDSISSGSSSSVLDGLFSKNMTSDEFLQQIETYTGFSQPGKPAGIKYEGRLSG